MQNTTFEVIANLCKGYRKALRENKCVEKHFVELTF